MKHLACLLVGLLIATLTLVFVTTAVIAQEKAKGEKAKAAVVKETQAIPANVLFENEKVRVPESRYKPGEKNEIKMREDRVIIALQDSKLRYHFPDGKTEDVEHKVGKAQFRKKGTSQVENIGQTESRNMLVTLK
jgi:hypothetical protein